MKRQDDNGENTLHVDATGGSGTNVDLVGINGTPPSTGNGTADAGTLRVTVASDSPGGTGTSSPFGDPFPLTGTAAGFIDDSGNMAGATLDASGNLLVNVAAGSSGNSAASATGAAVPADADYTGLNVAGTLRGATGVNPAGSVFAQQVDIASVNGVAAATVPVTVAAGSAVIGHVITDTGSTTAVTGNVTVVQPTGTNLHTVLDSGTLTTLTTVTNPVTVAQATASSLNATVVQATGTNLHAVIDSGTLTTVSTVTAVTAITNALPAGTNLLGKVSASDETSTIYSGTTALVPKFAAISASSNGNNTVIVAGTNKIRVLGWNLMASGTVNVKWQSGAGGTDLTGLYYLIANTGISVAYSPVGWFETASATLLNLNLSAGVAVGGNICYIDVA